MESVVATVSGYHGSERFRLIKLISQSGASYVGAMNPSTTHLVCYKFEGRKYELARKFKIIIVNHRWIEDCIKQGRRVSERPYTKHCGSVIGPLQLEIPVAAKTSVINVDSDDDGDGGDDEWTESWLLKENLSPVVRQNKDRSGRSKRKATKRCPRQDVSLTYEYGLDESSFSGLRKTESDDEFCLSSSHLLNKKRINTTIGESSKSSRRLIRKNICKVINSSDSDSDFKDKEIHNNNVDIDEPSLDFRRQKCELPFRNRLNGLTKRTLILEDSENIEDLSTLNLQDPSCNDNDDSAKVDDLGTSNIQDPPCDADDSNARSPLQNPRLSTQQPLSCVICWTDFSSTRGVLPCGHRFCFSCIQNWADHMVSMKKVSTCPLCKASFYSIQKMEEAASSDQKIYSQTVPNDPFAIDVCVLPYVESYTHQIMPPPRPVCHRCSCREPEELLITCHICDLRCIHNYCLDPPQSPWICVHCKDLRMRYVR
ncbi:uncharacterized protein [Rutidosis leptorrhynchoides]|uniref:uncharacterized protein n=1 Tax=Rutidosis leptorrhynchoides TaxID=125765 RepID=UPI003A99591A